MEHLSREQESELITEAQRGDIASRNQLVMSHFGWCQSIARKYSVVFSGNDFDDLTQFAVIGLIRAIATIDTTRGYRLSTYARKRIVGEIVTNAMRLDSVVVIPEKYGHTEHAKIARQCQSLNEQNHCRTMEIGEALPSPEVDLDERIDLANEIKRMRAAINRLPVLLRTVLDMRTGGKHFREIGRIVGCSKTRVFQLESEAMAKVKVMVEIEKQDMKDSAASRN